MSPSALITAAALLPLASAAVLDPPIWIRNTYASVQISAGTPEVPHFLMFDTGSASSWIVNDYCATQGCPFNPKYPRTGYDIEKTSTGVEIGPYSWIYYLDSAVGGMATEDVFEIKTDSGNLEWNQTFLAVTSNDFRWITADGFLGMAFSTIAMPNTTTLFETLMQQGLVDEPRFSVYYGHEVRETGDAGDGFLTLGGSHEDKYVDGELQWVPLQENENQVWRTGIQGFKGSKSVDGGAPVVVETDFPAGQSSWAVFDTGAGGITIPASQIESVYASIGMNWTAIIEGDHIPKCAEFDDSWSVSLVVGGTDGSDPVEITLTGSQLALPGFGDGSADSCYPPIDSGDTDGFVLVGTRLLRQVYTVWDFGAFDAAEYKPRIGFGKFKSEFKPNPIQAKQN